MVRINGDVLLDLGLVDTFQNGQPVAHAADPHFLELIVLQRNQCLADNLVFFAI